MSKTSVIVVDQCLAGGYINLLYTQLDTEMYCIICNAIVCVCVRDQIRV